MLIGRPQTAVIAVAGLRIQGCEHVAGRTDVVAGVEVAENRVVFRDFETAGIRRCDRATESLVEVLLIQPSEQEPAQPFSEAAVYKFRKD